MYNPIEFAIPPRRGGPRGLGVLVLQPIQARILLSLILAPLRGQGVSFSGAFFASLEQYLNANLAGIDN